MIFHVETSSIEEEDQLKVKIRWNRKSLKIAIGTLSGIAGAIWAIFEKLWS